MEIVMSTVIASKFALNRGNARVWCEGRKLAREGIAVGMKYELKFDQANRQVNVLFGHDLVNVSGSVSRRKLRGTDNEYLPVIDMSDKKFLELFEESEEIRIAINGLKMTITAQLSSSDAKERVARLQRKLANREPLTVCSLFHGGGVT